VGGAKRNPPYADVRCLVGYASLHPPYIYRFPDYNAFWGAVDSGSEMTGVGASENEVPQKKELSMGWKEYWDGQNATYKLRFSENPMMS